MKTIALCTLVLLNLGLSGCQEKKPVDRMSDEELKAYADKLAHQYIITDTHIDLPTALIEKKFKLGRDNDTLIHTGKGDFDFERAKKGGLDAPFMSIYIPSAYQKRADKGKSFADTLIAMVDGIATQMPDKFALANSPAEVRANFKAGKISLPMGMENGAPIGDDLKNVQYFFDHGIRYVTLTHGKDNQICDSSYDSTFTWKGLSPFGRLVVAEMNRVGIMVDISHVTDSVFYQVVRMTKVPVIASHSSCRSFTPGFWRNMSDEMIKKLGENGGVIQISFGSMFLDSAVRAKNEVISKKLKVVLDQKKLKPTDSVAKPIIAQFRKENPSAYPDVEKVVDHIDHVVKLIGVDHVGFGSDFDGVGDSLPTGLKDVSMYPNILYGLLKRGYTEADIEKICGGNLLRVWQQVEDASTVKG
jgi:membrane dipeptidase